MNTADLVRLDISESGMSRIWSKLPQPAKATLRTSNPFSEMCHTRKRGRVCVAALSTRLSRPRGIVPFDRPRIEFGAVEISLPESFLSVDKTVFEN